MNEKTTEKIPDSRAKKTVQKRISPGRLREECDRIAGEQGDSDAGSPSSKLKIAAECLLDKMRQAVVSLIKRHAVKSDNILANLLKLFVQIHRCVGNVIIWLIRKCCVPFRYIHAGITYAILFLIIAWGIASLNQFGEGAALMKNPRELQPAYLDNKNEISFMETERGSEVSMFFKTLDPVQRKVYLELKKDYSGIVALKKELEVLEKADDPAIQELSEDELKSRKDAILIKLRDRRREFVQKTKPITGFGVDSFNGVRSVVITPEILEVTITVVNVNQGDPQKFTFRLYNPDMDIEANNLPAISKKAIATQMLAWFSFDIPMPEKAGAIRDRVREWHQKNPEADISEIPVKPGEFMQAEWQLQNDILKKLCHQIRENQRFEDQYTEALKLKDAADIAARKLKDEARRNEILSKRVEDYFCDSVSVAERNLLDTVILAVNKDSETPSSANKHETEKVYVYVNRIPPQISIGFTKLNELALISDFLQVLKYPDDGDFVYAGNDARGSLETSFRCANTKVISPNEQRKRIQEYLKRDVIAENLEKINAVIIADAARKNKLNDVRIENEVLIAIARRPEGAPPLTPEGRENIRREVIKQLDLKHEEPILKQKKDISVEDKQRWLETAMADAGINPANLFYLPSIVETIRENEQLDTVNCLFSSAIVFGLAIFFGICALVAFSVFLSQCGIGILNTIRRRFLKEAEEIGANSRKLVVFRKVCYWIILAGLIVFFLYWSALFFNLCDVPDQVLGVLTEKELFSTEERTLIWLHYFNFWVPGFILWLIAICAFFTPGVKQDFSRPAGNKAFVAELFTGKNNNPPFAGSFSWVTAYILIFLLLPCLLVFQYINIIPNPFAPNQDDFLKLDSYDIVAGGGDAMPAKPVAVKKVKKKKQKKFVVSTNTSVIWEIPPLNDEEHMEEIDTATETQYATGSMFGKGKKTGKPGWAGGIENAKIRFIRLQYSGQNWDWNMGKGADYNMLVYLRDQIGFNVANDTEAITINKLARGFRKGKKPPFVYLTGRGAINLSSTEVKQLNEYLLKDGGMIFADNAGGSFDSGFRNMIKRVLPNHKLVDIANDDPIYTAPFYFPNGAPAFFHHSGTRALGIKNNGRWVVFYHQGDIGDAWKGAGLTEQQRTDAFKLGSNIISYAFSAYLESNSGGK